MLNEPGSLKILYHTDYLKLLDAFLAVKEFGREWIDITVLI